MREFGRSESRWREEDLDEYEDEEADGYRPYGGYDDMEDDEEGGGEDGYEEEEEEERPPAPEEMEYMSMREKLKEKYRKKVRAENGSALGKSGSSSERKPPAPANNEFGSFFGPSKPAVSRRVIEERHAMLETQHIRTKEPSSTSDQVRRVVSSSDHEVKRNLSQERAKAVKEVKSKAQALKDIRDYSFLFSDDADMGDFAKEKEPKKPSFHSDARSVEASRPKVPSSKPSVSAPSARDKKTGGPNHNVHARMQTSTNGLKPSSAGNGSSRPPMQRGASSGRPQSTALNKPTSTERKPAAVKPDASIKRVPDAREYRELPKSKVMGQQTSSFRPQLPSSSRPPQPSSRPQQFSPSSRPSSSSRPQQPLPSSRPQQPLPSSRPQQPLPSSRPQQPSSSSRPQQPSSSSRPQQPTSSSRPQQPTSSRPQQHPPYKSPQLTSSRPPQQKIQSRPQAQTVSRPQQASSLKHQPQMASRPHQSFSSRPAQNMPSSKVQPSSSKPQMSKPFKSMSQQRPQESRLKKRTSRYSDEESDEDAKALSMLRRLTGYNPRRFADDDEDDSEMEATFDDIMNEEFRSEQIARKEDEEQLRLIQQEEEEEERRRKIRMAKKRKMR